MRLFVGIPVQAGPRLAEAVQELGRQARGARVMPPANLHLTLRFLGEVPDAAPVEAALRAELRGAAPVRGALAGLGGFPEARHARIAWAGVQAPGLDAVAQRVRFATQALGVPEAHPFTPHLTLARLPQPQDLTAWCGRHAGEAWGALVADAVVLYRSRTGLAGSTYESLATVPLGAPLP
ncbi:MAG: RNA 2',3'-cyclic phosphodiesterase [Halobacteriales archaeon]|nr:RNA 2',3'-cyclic phosphodiesterase [Halobacteriales archaeon]